MGILLILAAIIVAVVLLGSGWIAVASAGDDLAFWILLAVALVTGFFLLLFAVPKIVAGIGLINLKPWSRYLAMVLAVFSLFNIPIGTAIGIYTLWALIQNETEDLFSAQRDDRREPDTADPITAME
jgi:hypothetical protein